MESLRSVLNAELQAALTLMYLPTPVLSGSGVRVIPFGTSQHMLPWCLINYSPPHQVFQVFAENHAIHPG